MLVAGFLGLLLSHGVRASYVLLIAFFVPRVILVSMEGFCGPGRRAGVDEKPGNLGVPHQDELLVVRAELRLVSDWNGLRLGNFQPSSAVTVDDGQSERKATVTMTTISDFDTGSTSLWNGPERIPPLETHLGQRARRDCP